MESTATTEPSSVAAVPVRTRAPFAMNLQDGITYVFRSPDWFTDLAVGAVCYFLNSLVVPPYIFVGYAYAVAEALHRQHGTWHPAFRTHKIADYLVRGLAPLALDLGVQIVIAGPIVLGVIMVVMSHVSGTAVDLTPWYAALAGGVLLYFVITFFTSIMAFRAGIANNLAAAFDFAWVLEFVLKTWPELILITIARVLLRFALVLLAVATAGIGGLFASAYDQMVLAHWMYQAYRVHLARGGTPIPLSTYRE